MFKPPSVTPVLGTCTRGTSPQNVWIWNWWVYVRRCKGNQDSALKGLTYRLTHSGIQCKTRRLKSAYTVCGGDSLVNIRASARESWSIRILSSVSFVGGSHFCTISLSTLLALFVLPCALPHPCPTKPGRWAFPDMVPIAQSCQRWHEGMSQPSAPLWPNKTGGYTGGNAL